MHIFIIITDGNIQKHYFWFVVFGAVGVNNHELFDFILKVSFSRFLLSKIIHFEEVEIEVTFHFQFDNKNVFFYESEYFHLEMLLFLILRCKNFQNAESNVVKVMRKRDESRKSNLLDFWHFLESEFVNVTSVPNSCTKKSHFHPLVVSIVVQLNPCQNHLF